MATEMMSTAAPAVEATGLVTLSSPPAARDGATLSNYAAACVEHMDVRALHVNFDAEKLTGVVEYTVRAVVDGVDALVLDTKALEIEYARIGEGTSNASLSRARAVPRSLRLYMCACVSTLRCISTSDSPRQGTH